MSSPTQLPAGPPPPAPAPVSAAPPPPLASDPLAPLVRGLPTPRPTYDCGPPPPWPPDDQADQVLPPLPDPAGWTGGLVGILQKQDLIAQGYTAHYVGEWANAVSWYWNCQQHQPPPKPPPKPPPPPPGPSSGDPAGEPGDPPTDRDYVAWEFQYQLEHGQVQEG